MEHVPEVVIRIEQVARVVHDDAEVVDEVAREQFFGVLDDMCDVDITCRVTECFHGNELQGVFLAFLFLMQKLH